MSYNRVKQRLWYDLTNDLMQYRHTYYQTVDGYRLIASGYKYAGWSGFYKYIELPRKARFVSQYMPREIFKRMLELMEANNLEYQLKYLPEKVRL
jgi:hypothetical protein